MSHAGHALANPGLLGRVLDWVRARVPEGSDIANLSRDDLRHIAEDLSLSESDLLAMSSSGQDNTALMERMIRARGLDPTECRRAFGSLLRDVTRVCTGCENAARCRRELDVGMAGEHSHEFCPNAGTFDDMLEMGADCINAARR